VSAPVILFAEVPRFYTAVERARHPELADRPILVGGDPRKRGRVQSASSEAEAAGVEVGMPMLEALERCPRARALRTDMKADRDASEALRARLRSVIDALEPEGLGAAFLDASRRLDDPEQLARQLRERVRAELGLDLRVGIAPVRFVAELASRESGEGGVLRIRPGGETAFLAPLDVRKLPGVGPRAATELGSMGVTTVGQLLRVGRGRLEERFGNRGRRMLELARGHDPRGVRAARHPRSASQELTFDEPVSDIAVLTDAIHRLARGLEESLRRSGLAARRVGLKVRWAEGPVSVRSRTSPTAVAAAADLADAALALLGRTEAGERPVRGLGVSATQLARGAADDRQLDLFSGNH